MTRRIMQRSHAHEMMQREGLLRAQCPLRLGQSSFGMLQMCSIRNLLVLVAGDTSHFLLAWKTQSSSIPIGLTCSLSGSPRLCCLSISVRVDRGVTWPRHHQ